MPVYFLKEELLFPDPEAAQEDGLLALEGDLSVKRLILAYKNGIFPWYSQDSPILWWSPDPRMLLYLDNLKVSNSLKQVINSKQYEVKFDTQFEKVIRHCANLNRKNQTGTWITQEMINAYIKLYQEGYVHSAETYHNNELVGGLYGVSIGKAFFGESMFYLSRDASKIALFHLVEKLKKWDFDFIDVQQETSHLRSLGATSVSRKVFLKKLKNAINAPSRKGPWN